MDEEPLFPPGVPEEWKERVRSKIERQEMQSVDINHTIISFIQELSDDQLDSLETMLTLTGMSEEAAQYYLGVISGVAMLKFGRCPYCRVNHEQEICSQLPQGGGEGG